MARERGRVQESYDLQPRDWKRFSGIKDELGNHGILQIRFRPQLGDGNEIPVLGFGIYELLGENTYRAVKWVLEAGYRHISGMRRMWSSFCIESCVSSADIFFITKLKHNHNVGFDVNINAIICSLELCGLDYIDIDLYLFMGPGAGKVKSIGISTFGVFHMQELFDSWESPPAVYQVRGLRFDHPLIVGLANNYGKGPAHILIRYSLQKGFASLVKYADHRRIVSNADVFDFGLDAIEIQE
ncbi:NADP-dependent oxidoreductase domain-containing protein [Russula aff. rugulosa BPL654]|nr:NADP-dependent oxidoreductase domain-containing protein [Russula aff. rugulosa BPL654]